MYSVCAALYRQHQAHQCYTGYSCKWKHYLNFLCVIRALLFFPGNRIQNNSPWQHVTLTLASSIRYFLEKKMYTKSCVWRKIILLNEWGNKVNILDISRNQQALCFECVRHAYGTAVPICGSIISRLYRTHQEIWQPVSVHGQMVRNSLNRMPWH